MADLNLTQLRVLVIDDNAFACEMMKFALQTLNTHSVATAHGGVHGLELIHTFEPDLVLLDWMMPPPDGLEVLKQLRANVHSPFRTVPVIMVTAFSELWRVQAARDAGANEFVVKPFSARIVYARIKGLVENPRAFVDKQAFSGPDRRRREKEVGDDRRAEPSTAGDDGVTDALKKAD